MIKLLSITVVSVLFFGNTAPAQSSLCATTTRIMFPAGQDHTTIAGAIVESEAKCITLVAISGQRAMITVHSLGDNAVFQLYQPGWKVGEDEHVPIILGNAYSGVADGDDARSWSGTLIGKGRQLITVGST
jgi:hypothetical protein